MTIIMLDVEDESPVLVNHHARPISSENPPTGRQRAIPSEDHGGDHFITNCCSPPKSSREFVRESSFVGWAIVHSFAQFTIGPDILKVVRGPRPRFARIAGVNPPCPPAAGRWMREHSHEYTRRWVGVAGGSARARIERGLVYLYF